MALEEATLANISFSDTKLKIRRGTAAEWAAANPILEAGEPALETDTGILRIGDGTTVYTSLPSCNGAAVDAELTKVANSNLSATHKITRSATLVIAASNSSAKGKTQADYVCDGTADNVEIQAALDALPATGGRVILLEGTFRIPSSVWIRLSNIILDGQGNGTILSLADGANVNVISLGNDGASYIENIWVKNLDISGNSANQTNTSHGIFFDRKVRYTFVDGVCIKNCYTDGINLYATSTDTAAHRNTITNTIIENCGRDGIHDEYGHMLTISGCPWISSCGTNGVYLKYANSWRITDCLIFACTNACLKLENTYAGQANKASMGSANYAVYCTQSSQNFFSECDFEDSNLAGIYLTAFSSINVIEQCIFPYGKNQLIYITGTSNYNNVSNCIIGNGGSLTNNTYDDILIYNSLYNKISNNTFYTHVTSANKPRYIICESGTSNFNRIDNNNFHDSYYNTGIILKAGVDTSIKSNMGYATENTGTATITAAATTVDVTHGLAAAPTRVIISPTTATAGKQYYVSAKAATTFTITIDSAAEADISFDWQAVV